MKKEIIKKITIPEGVSIKIQGNEILAKSGSREAKRKVVIPGNVEVKISNNEIEVIAKNASRRESKIIGTIVAHIKNLIKGMSDDFVYKLEICNVHFPMIVKVEGKIFTIKSFLGEVHDRKAQIVDNVKVDVKGNHVTVSSPDREAAGQTAANIESSTKITGRDRRVFQDGIYITEKPGRKI